MHTLATPIAYLKGVGPKRAEVLEKDLSIRTLRRPAALLSISLCR